MGKIEEWSCILASIMSSSILFAFTLQENQSQPALGRAGIRKATKAHFLMFTRHSTLLC
jgi:hypothetical protein